MRAAAIALVLCLCAPALAETRDELQANGEALGREGKWGEAIHAFKAAEQVEHRTIHACLIMLAYTRREAWAQAEVFLSQCLVPTTGETLPDWVGDAERLISDRLRSEPLAPVTIEVKPIDAAVTLTASSFEPDESFRPRTLHLSRGHHLIIAHAPGYADQQRTLDIDSTAARHIVIDLNARPDVAWSRSKKLVVGGGAALIGLGTVSYAVMGVMYLELPKSDAFNNSRPNALETTYKLTRATTIGCWAVGAGLVLAGALMHSNDPEATQVSAAPIPGGAMVTVGWTR